MKNKIILVNAGEKKFAKDFVKYSKLKNVEIIECNAKSDYYVDLTQKGKVALFINNTEINQDEIMFSFIRLRSKNALATSILSTFFSTYKIPFSERVYIEHTESEEKVTQMLKLHANNLPVPKTLIFSQKAYQKSASNIISKLEFPMVLKTNGNRAMAVWKIEKKEEMDKIINSIEKEDGMFLIQEYLPNQYDIRVLMYDGNILGSIKRSSQDSFYNNISKGGSSKKEEITSKEALICKNASELLGIKFAGIDFIRTPEGIKILEINTAPQVTGFEEAFGVDVAKTIVDKIIDNEK